MCTQGADHKTSHSWGEGPGWRWEYDDWLTRWLWGCDKSKRQGKANRGQVIRLGVATGTHEGHIRDKNIQSKAEVEATGSFQLQELRGNFTGPWPLVCVSIGTAAEGQSPGTFTGAKWVPASVFVLCVALKNSWMRLQVDSMLIGFSLNVKCDVNRKRQNKLNF